MLHSRIRLRAVNPEDAPFLCRVANVPELMDIFGDSPSEWSGWRDAIDAWRGDPDEEDYIIVREPGDACLGWLGINGLLAADRLAWLKMLALLPEFWGQGYGSEALRQAKALLAAKGCSRLRLWTDRANRRARDCYQRNGFAVIGETTTPVGTRRMGHERVLMECLL